MAHDTPAPYIPRRFYQDAGELKDYTWDWSPWLTHRSDSIATATFEILSESVIKESENTVGDFVTTFISLAPGIIEGKYRVTCEIETTGGQRIRRSIELIVRDDL